MFRTKTDSLALLLSIGLILIPKWSHAVGSWDNFGFGGRASAMGSAFTGVADDGSAVYYNPAGITLVDKANAVISLIFGQSDIHFNGEKIGMKDWQGADIGIATKVPFGGFLTDRLYFGMGVHAALPDILQDQVSPTRTEPFFFRIQEAQRLSGMALLGLPIIDGFSIGGGTIIQLGVTGAQFQFGTDPRGAGTVSGDLSGPLQLSPLVGFLVEPGRWWSPLEGLRAGATYRTQVDIHVKLTTDIEIQGLQIPFQTEQRVSADPEQVAFGLSYRVGPSLLVASDITWKNWSKLPSPYAAIDFGGVFDALDATPPDMKFKDTYVPGVGIEYTFFPDLEDHFILRAGYRFEESPVPPQTGETNLLDNDQQVITAGAGLTIAELMSAEFDPPFSIDLSFQYHLLEDRTVEKSSGATTKTTGSYWLGGLSTTIRF